ncbi:hypothetical protein Trydic_g12578 [Trypoxylus dichotomus]
MLQRCGATPAQADPYLYWIHSIICSKDTKTVEGIVRTMSNEFQLKELGGAQYCLGCEFNIKDEEILLLQKGYIQDVLERFGMTDCKPVSTPLNPNDRLMESTRELTEEASKQPYRQLVVALTYPPLCTKPDISFAVRAAISWESKKQPAVALSATEAECTGLTEVAKEAIYLRRFLIELGVERLADAKVYNDNLSALRLAEILIYHVRSKHIDVRHHFVRDVLKSGQLEVLHIGTNDIIADVLTKGLPRTKRKKCVESLGLTGL